jgi:hypothetical protein
VILIWLPFIWLLLLPGEFDCCVASAGKRSGRSALATDDNMISNPKVKIRMSPPVSSSSGKLIFSAFAAIPQFLVAKTLPRFFSQCFGLQLIESLPVTTN